MMKWDVFFNCLRQIENKKSQNHHEEAFDYKSNEAIDKLKEYNIKLELF